MLLVLHRHTLALSQRKEITLRRALAQDFERAAQLRIITNLTALLGGVTKSNSSDAPADEPIDLRAAGIELSLVDLDPLSDESVVELVAPRLGHHELGSDLVLVLDGVVDEGRSHNLRLGSEKVEKLLLISGE